MKDPLRRTHATLLLERSPLAHDGYAIALKLFKDFWSYLAVTLLLFLFCHSRKTIILA
ncbi:hypothetical protein [Nostoc sp.]|uniref:hypothetical protein n=1 Tax=Nostoc sp. TaxID=1180 RepID=UPI002FF871FB